MASIACLLEDAYKIFNEITLREDDAELNRRKEFIAARKIQSCFRGWFIRNHLHKLHSAATTIQRHWRGFSGRTFYFILLKKAVNKMCLQHYNLTATKIQKLWRGHYVRSRFFDYYKLKQWIHQVLEKNKFLIHQMQNYKEVVEASKIDALELEAKQWVFYILFKLHHLLRTQALPGIYSLPNTVKLSVLEEQLKALQFTDYMKILHKQRKAMRNRCRDKPSTQLIFKGPLRRCEKYWRERNNTHPGRLFAQGVYDDEFSKVLKPHDEAQGKDIRVNDLYVFALQVVY
uniref:Spermatogenesis-associated protein 17 n=1 Tax=Timema cristinae TaxID=61476 RepID=A0A7R9GZZ0_TIMCR|nr:unnamed protein product [Timema cristinae]